MKRNTKTKTESQSAPKAQSRIQSALKATGSALSARKTNGTKQAAISPDEFNRRVAEKAYQLFERRGYSHGNDWFDWQIAQDIVRLECVPGKNGRGRKTLSDQELKEMTERKAHELFERSLHQKGSDLFNWLIAEEIVRLESSAKN